MVVRELNFDMCFINFIRKNNLTFFKNNFTFFVKCKMSFIREAYIFNFILNIIVFIFVYKII